MAIQHEFVEYTHEGDTLEAYISWDDAISGPRPCVLISHAWGGRGDFEMSKADDIAAAGYVGFALDLYGKGILGSSKDENSALMKPFIEDRHRLQSRLDRALETACQSTNVDATRVAVMGYCFGGLCALDMARTGAGVVGAISVHGLFSAPDNTGKITAKVLALHGWDDPMATPENVLEFTREMSDAGADWQLHAYGNTVHAFTNPKAADPEFGTVYNPDADRRAWAASLQFLLEVYVV